MKEQMSNRTLFLYFTSLTGAVIAGIVWLYLKVANIGITVIWEMVPAYIDSKYYTVLMCLGGGGYMAHIRSGWQILLSG